MKKIFILSFLIFAGLIMSGCIRTSEDIRLDNELNELKKTVEINNQQLNNKIDKEVQSIRDSQVNLLSKLENNSNDIRDLRNRLDILQHRLNNLKQDLDLFTTTGGTLNTSIEQRLSALETSMTAVEAWMSFSRAYGNRAVSHSTETSVKKHPVPGIDDAIRLFKEGKFEDARHIFERYANTGSPIEKARATFYLGEIAYREKDYKQAIANYGTIVEKYPDSPLITSAYYMIGKSFVNLGDKKKAKLFFEELVTRYPKDRLSKSAKIELEKLK
ncbi:MAG: tetratricopeptide repeat protein [bacterium]